ncbi:hypothetical protein [Neolewinella litorea]|uniref:Uncharacterized protein n=1 Tax=Neolewinella litorea TaxID=2562452 RepID=A0A4S4N8Z9_9BACT|nr:hypothetical protein [Neolewinella litorea]THH35619.1 hypothetical protein E4021_16155 [Neolewinella litorea]
MSSTTTGNQSSNRCALLAIPPNTAPTGGPGSPPGPTPAAGPPPAFNGIPEHVPQRTFISSPRVAGDDFLEGARTYHQNCGLAPVWVDSLAHMVRLLSEDTLTHFDRIRLVTHANGDDLIIPLFGQSTVQADRHALEDHLNGFAESDERGILSILDLGLGQHFFSWSNSTILAVIRAGNSGLLAPYGIATSGLPPGDLQRFLFYCCDLVFVTANRVKRNGSNLNAADKNSLLRAVRRLIDLTAPATGADALRTFLTGRPVNDLGPDATHTFNYTLPAGAMNLFLLAGRAAEASEAGFRTQLTTVKNRLDSNSTLDVRGCRAGQYTSYLRALQAFFGRTGNRPKITAPRWYQFFGSCERSVVGNNAELRNLLQTGADAAGIRAAFAEWMDRSRVQERHQPFWLARLLRNSGNVIRFCQLVWRADLPPLAPPLSPVGWPAFLLLNFAQAMTKVAEFFNVTGSGVPTAAQLTALQPLVSTKLDGYASFLFATVDEANKAATFTALSQIDTEIGTTLVPNTAPAPLQVSQVTGYQAALINALETTQLAPIRNLMAACEARIQDAADPGMYYYMINAGLPVFLFRTEERMLTGHRISATHNRIVVHATHRDPAFRQWPRLLWAEPLPAANTIDTLVVTNADARRFAMMVRSAEPGDTDVAACPHPTCDQALEKVTNTPDSLF